MACHLLYKKAIVIDFGSLTTLDVIKDGKFLGGLITQGFGYFFHFYKNIKRLKDIQISLRKKEILQRDTKSCLESGLYFGYPFMINQIIKGLKKQVGNLNVVICGGYSEILKEFISHDIYDKYLTLKGAIFYYQIIRNLLENC